MSQIVTEFPTDEPLRVVRALALREHIKSLPSLQRQVVEMLHGIGCGALTAEEVAGQLGLTDVEVWRLREAAVLELGARTCLEAAA